MSRSNETIDVASNVRCYGGFLFLFIFWVRESSHVGQETDLSVK